MLVFLAFASQLLTSEHIDTLLLECTQVHLLLRILSVFQKLHLLRPQTLMVQLEKVLGLLGAPRLTSTGHVWPKSL